jgi:hypothetical protein
VLPVRIALCLIAVTALSAGCGDGGYGSNPPGKDAKKTEFTKDEARAAQPARGGSEKADE